MSNALRFTLWYIAITSLGVAGITMAFGKTKALAHYERLGFCIAWLMLGVCALALGLAICWP